MTDLHDAMLAACDSVQITPPRQIRAGAWVQCAVIGKRPSNKSGRVLVFEDQQGGIAWNWATGMQQRFSVNGRSMSRHEPKRNPAKDRQREQERIEIARICDRLVKSATPAPHSYLISKGFPDELALVLDHVDLPDTVLGNRLRRALPESDEPLMIVPGRIAKSVTTVQFITSEGAKKNILGGKMGGAYHRIATGAETWVCEGIATALSVRAALRMLGRSVTVLTAFSASNVAKVARGLRGAIIAADNDRAIEQFDGQGTGEYYAQQSGCRWTKPPERGDFNDMHKRDGLRAVVMHLREIKPP